MYDLQLLHRMYFLYIRTVEKIIYSKEVSLIMMATANNFKTCNSINIAIFHLFTRFHKNPSIKSMFKQNIKNT